MGFREARSYLQKLRKKQGNPYLWPDFLTGLPDKGAVIDKTGEVYPKLGRYAISYIKIANIDPYIIKYGSDRHAEIIQWAAAFLKTTAEKHKCFVGTYDTHDFVAAGERKKMKNFLKESSQLFSKKAKTYYRKDDLQRENFMSFQREGRKVEIGFMRLVDYTLEEQTAVSMERLLPYMARLCKEQE